MGEEALVIPAVVLVRDLGVKMQEGWKKMYASDASTSGFGMRDSILEAGTDWVVPSSN